MRFYLFRRRRFQIRSPFCPIGLSFFMYKILTYIPITHLLHISKLAYIRYSGLFILGIKIFRTAKIYEQITNEFIASKYA